VLTSQQRNDGSNKEKVYHSNYCYFAYNVHKNKRKPVFNHITKRDNTKKPAQQKEKNQTVPRPLYSYYTTQRNNIHKLGANKTIKTQQGH